jgi:hypothetical protein
MTDQTKLSQHIQRVERSPTLLEPHIAVPMVARAQVGGPMPAGLPSLGSWAAQQTRAGANRFGRFNATVSALPQQKGPTLDGHACILVSARAAMSAA